jgi:hypothetical protein
MQADNKPAESSVIIEAGISLCSKHKQVDVSNTDWLVNHVEDTIASFTNAIYLVVDVTYLSGRGVSMRRRTVWGGGRSSSLSPVFKTYYHSEMCC